MLQVCLRKSCDKTEYPQNSGANIDAMEITVENNLVGEAK